MEMDEGHGDGRIRPDTFRSVSLVLGSGVWEVQCHQDNLFAGLGDTVAAEMLAQIRRSSSTNSVMTAWMISMISMISTKTRDEDEEEDRA